MSAARRTFIELALLGLNVLFVTQAFRFIEPRQIAAVVAGVSFILVSGLTIWLEGRFGRGQRSLAWWLSILFLGSCAIPILALRLLFWELPFDQVGFWGIKGPELHRFSTYLYMVIIAAVVIEGVRKDKIN